MLYSQDYSDFSMLLPMDLMEISRRLYTKNCKTRELLERNKEKKDRCS